MPIDQVNLRPLLVSDCTQRYVGWLNDPAVNRWLETRWSPWGLDAVRRYVEDQTLPDRELLAICLGDEHIGNLKIGPIHPVHNHADLSYFIGETFHWNKGYASQAVRLACERAFKVTKIHRLNAGCYADNQASRRVLIRNGFAFEGAARRQLKTDNGWMDHCWYGRCNDQVAI